MAHPYRRVRARQQAMPEVGISEEGSIRSLHLGSATIQSSMNLDNPTELVLSYSRAMMAWLLFADGIPKHITQIGLGGGSFVRWIDAFLPDVKQTVVEINPQVVAVAKSLFELPFESEQFEIVLADGAQYIKTVRSGTDVILVDGFDGEQIIDDLVSVDFFMDCRRALSEQGVFVSNWWSGDKRYPQFIHNLREVFQQRVLEIPAQSHGNVAVMAFVSAPREQRLDKLLKLAEQLSEQYALDFKEMVYAARASNANNGKTFFL